MHRRNLTSLLTLLVCLLIMVCGAANSVAAADGKALRLITFPGYAPPELVKKFQQETGITVEVTDSSNEDMIAKLRAIRGGGFDLAQPSQDRIVAVTQQFGLY
jgi:spermidine/putrescine transport system substrate-binding protein